MSIRDFSVRSGAEADFLCMQDEPVFNLTVGNFATLAEKQMSLGPGRPAGVKELNAYRRRATPHLFTDLTHG